MGRNILFTLFLSLCFCVIQAQDAPVATVEPAWKSGAGLGLSLDQLLLINPKVGAGQSRIGFGGLANWFSNYKKGRASWDNNASLNLGIQKIGTGFLASDPTRKIPFLKTVDELRFGSKFGYSFKEGSKWFMATDLGFMSQLARTYEGNYLEPISDQSKVLSKFLSPAFATLSVGLDYKPDAHWSIYFSPIAYKANIVLDDSIAATGAFGNEITPEVKNIFHQFGALLKPTYTNKYFNDKFMVKSALALYTNYLKDPQNIDVDWTNEFSYEIFKGFQLSLFTNLFYDHDVKVQISDFTQVGGVQPGVLGRRISFTENFLLKYSLNF
jgi:hypothetical protein